MDHDEYTLSYVPSEVGDHIPDLDLPGMRFWLHDEPDASLDFDPKNFKFLSLIRKNYRRVLAKKKDKHIVLMFLADRLILISERWISEKMSSILSLFFTY